MTLKYLPAVLVVVLEFLFIRLSRMKDEDENMSLYLGYEGATC